MTVTALDHVNIQTPDVAGTARFFEDVLGLVARCPFPGADTANVTWMFDAQDRPLVHITRPGVTFDTTPGDVIGTGTGPLHHVAFECVGHDAMLARLTRLGLAHRVREIAEIGLRQIFVHEPNGVLLELNYRER